MIFGEPIWDPVQLLSRFESPLVIFLSLVSLLVATLTTNIAANVVSPANDFSNVRPRWISFRTGGLITAVLGIVMMPWRLLSDFGTYIFGWLVGYSGFLGPIAGVLIADYWLIRRQSLEVGDLYRRGGAYEYSRGFNPRALLALGAPRDARSTKTPKPRKARTSAPSAARKPRAAPPARSAPLERSPAPPGRRSALEAPCRSDARRETDRGARASRRSPATRARRADSTTRKSRPGRTPEGRRAPGS